MTLEGKDPESQTNTRGKSSRNEAGYQGLCAALLRIPAVRLRPSAWRERWVGVGALWRAGRKERERKGKRREVKKEEFKEGVGKEGERKGRGMRGKRRKKKRRERKEGKRRK